MGLPGVDRTIEFIQRNFDVPILKQNVQDYISKSICLSRVETQVLQTTLHSTYQFQTTLGETVSRLRTSKVTHTNREHVLLTVIDEFRRYPFEFAVKEANTTSIISALSQLFSIFAPPLAIHNYRGSVFESLDFRTFLDRWNVYKTRTTPYIPAGNGQCERLNGKI